MTHNLIQDNLIENMLPFQQDWDPGWDLPQDYPHRVTPNCYLEHHPRCRWNLPESFASSECTPKPGTCWHCMEIHNTDQWKVRFIFSCRSFENGSKEPPREKSKNYATASCIIKWPHHKLFRLHRKANGLLSLSTHTSRSSNKRMLHKILRSVVRSCALWARYGNSVM